MIVLATVVVLLSELGENEVFILDFFRFINNCKNFSNKKKRICEILQILGKSLLDKTPINQLLNKSDYQNVKERYCNTLLFNQIKRNTSN